MAYGARASGRQDQQGATVSARGKLRVFISYSRDDLTFADPFVAGTAPSPASCEVGECRGRYLCELR